MQTNIGLFARPQVKATYSLDLFPVDLNGTPEALVSLTRYWLGLFSHRREDSLWKGMLQHGHLLRGLEACRRGELLAGGRQVRDRDRPKVEGRIGDFDAVTILAAIRRDLRDTIHRSNSTVVGQAPMRC
jgi:hypothetical protein